MLSIHSTTELHPPLMLNHLVFWTSCLALRYKEVELQARARGKEGLQGGLHRQTLRSEAQG